MALSRAALESRSKNPYSGGSNPPRPTNSEIYANRGDAKLHGYSRCLSPLHTDVAELVNAAGLTSWLRMGSTPIVQNKETLL